MTVGHRLPLFSLLFLCGVAAVQWLPSLPGPVWALALPGAAWLVWRWPRLWPLATVLIGIAWAVLRAALVLADALPAELVSQDVWVNGVVVSLPVQKPHYQQFRFQVEKLIHHGKQYPSPGLVRLRWYEPNGNPVQAGEQWRLRVRLKPPRGFQNPGGFDYEGWLFRQRIRATGYVRAGTDSKPIAAPRRWSIDRWRQEVRAAVARLVPGPRAGLIAALAVGVRDEVGSRQWQVLRRTGTAHLLAISGLHIGLAAGLGMLLGAGLWRLNRRALLWRPAQQAGAVFGLLAATLYAGLAGFSIPTQRALIMVAVIMLGWLCRRQTTPTQVLALALLVVLLWDPLAVLDAGFWLSFGAVAAIYWCVARRSTIGEIGWWMRWRRWLLVQWLLWLTLAPLLLTFFGQVALTAPVANLIAVPIVAFTVVPLVLAGIIALPLGLEGVAAWVWQLADRILAGLWPCLEWLAALELGVWQGGAPPVWGVLLAVLGVVILALPRGLPGRATGLVLCLPALFYVPAAPAPGAFRVTVLDVGQGLAVVVRTRAHTLVYDTGARFRSGFDLGAAVVVPYLRNHRLPGPGQLPAPPRVDTLVVSHGDNDHIGGSRSLLAAVPVARRLSSVPQRVPGAEPCVDGQSWTWDGVRFEVLHPQDPYPLPHNNASCVVKVSGPHGSMLLTGDIEAAAEWRLLGRADRLASDVLLVPHQGSRTSSIPQFITAVDPRIAVVSTGYSNHYGHPHPQVVARYLRAGIAFYDTARSGAVTLRFAREGITLVEQRQRGHRYWFSP